MTRTGVDAIDWARSQNFNGSSGWEGKCLIFVRSCFDVPAYWGDAATAWNNANYKHRVSSGSNVPRGVPVYWTGGSRGYGHIAISTGGGFCWSTDILRVGSVDLVRIDEITARWGEAFQGWAEDVNNVRVWNPTLHQPSVWRKGDVYVAKLHRHQHDSDSVRRLQHRLLAHTKVPAKGVRVNGRYDVGTESAVQYWQRNVFSGKTGPRDGMLLNNPQANTLFGKAYRVVESK